MRGKITATDTPVGVWSDHHIGLNDTLVSTIHITHHGSNVTEIMDSLVHFIKGAPIFS